MRRSPIGSLAGLRSTRHGVSALAGLALAMVALSPAAPVSAATPSISLSVTYGTCNVYGSTATPGTLRLKLKSPAGALLGSYTEAIPAGSFHGCLGDVRIVGGDKVVAHLNGVKLNAVTVPMLAISANRVSDVLTVKAAAGTVLDVTATNCEPNGGCDGGYAKHLTMPAAGTWSKDLTAPVDLNGSDRVSATWTGPNRTFVSLNLEVPHLEVWLKRVQVYGAATPGHTVGVTLKDSDGQTRASYVTTAAADGRFFESLRNGGIGVKTAYGDVVRSDIASDAVVKVNISMQLLGGVIDQLIGHCNPNQHYTLSMTNANHSSTLTLFGVTDSNGGLIRTHLHIDENSGTTAVLTCGTPAGDYIRAAITFP
jgi:hypothetical protein